LTALEDSEIMSDCIFCKIIDGKIPCDKVYESDTVLAFRDINPQAPVHVLLVPKPHVATLNDLTSSDQGVMDGLYRAAVQVARELEVAESGYRTLVNCNDEGGQDVFHLHMHLLGGRRMGWPPG
jgi:histidine triad (HIT) family protein